MNWLAAASLNSPFLSAALGQDLTWQWSAAIQALEELTVLSWPVSQGFLLTGPAPVFQHPHLKSWIFSPVTGHQTCLPPVMAAPEPQSLTLIPLRGSDPLATQPFCLLLSPDWNLLLGFAPESGLSFSFDPKDIHQAWQQLQQRVQRHTPELVPVVNHWLLAHPPAPPDYRLVTSFSQALIRSATPAQTPIPLIPPPSPVSSAATDPPEAPPESNWIDLELWQALTHEVRTPLTTIHTLIQLLLKRPDLPVDVHRRLQTIAQECHEQVDRFNLIFHAAEVMAGPDLPPLTGLCSVSLEELLQDNIPRWQKQAQRRHLSLEMHYPPQLPAVTSDPNLLDQVLTGLVEHFSQTLPPLSTLQMRFSLAGPQLKVQLRSSEKHRSQTLASLGKLLMWQPETGHLSLNLTVTKTLFHALGGKLTVRHDHRWGDILTLYLPLNQTHQAY